MNTVNIIPASHQHCYCKHVSMSTLTEQLAWVHYLLKSAIFSLEKFELHSEHGLTVLRCSHNSGCDELQHNLSRSYCVPIVFDLNCMPMYTAILTATHSWYYLTYYSDKHA